MIIQLILLIVLSFASLNSHADTEVSEGKNVPINEAISSSENSSSEILEKSMKQLNILFNKTYRKSEIMIKAQGTFTPYGAVISPTGKVNFIHVNNETNANSEKTVQAIQSTMIDLAKQQKIFACVVYYPTKDLETVEGTLPLAIIGRLEHASGLSIAIASEIKLNNDVISYSTPITSEVPSEVFFWAHKEKQTSEQPNQSSVSM